MTVTGGGAGDDPTRVDRQPPAFPRVPDNQTDPTSTATAGGTPLFKPVGDPGAGAQMSPIVSQPIDSPPPNNRGGRVRWLVAGLATILVVALVGGALFLAAPRTGAPSATAHYVPADTAMYAEMRLDLPGDQHDNLASFMSHFPGFADQASFQTKFDETLNTLIARNGSNISWTNDVKPWFGGQVAFFGDVANPAMGTDGVMSGDPTHAWSHGQVVVLTVSDRAKLQATIDAHANGVVATPTDYNGTTISTIAATDSGNPKSYAITNDAVLLSADVDRIKEALDTRSGTSQALADDAYFLQELGKLHADRLATMYFDGTRLPEGASAPRSGATECIALQSGMQTRYVGEARAEGDHMAFTLRSQVPTGAGAPPAPQNGQSSLAEAMPANTAVYLETHNVGAGLGWLIEHGLDCMAAMPGPSPSTGGGPGGLGDTSKLFEQFLGAKPQDYFDFLQDAAIGASYANDAVGLGIVATVDDQAVATQRVDKLLSLIKLFGSGGGFGGASGEMPPITTEEIDHSGATVSVIHLGATDPGADPMTIQVAVANGRFYLGLNDFVVDALDRQPGESLASNDGYKKAIAAAPGDNAGSAYVDVKSAISAAVAKMDPEERARFEANAQPFIEPLTTFSMVNHVDGGTMISNGFLFVE